jgi:hypothetical protein
MQPPCMPCTCDRVSSSVWVPDSVRLTLVGGRHPLCSRTCMLPFLACIVSIVYHPCVSLLAALAPAPGCQPHAPLQQQLWAAAVFSAFISPLVVLLGSGSGACMGQLAGAVRTPITPRKGSGLMRSALHPHPPVAACWTPAMCRDQQQRASTVLMLCWSDSQRNWEPGKQRC